MTKVLISKKKKNILAIKITGHAFYASHGDDIVCSAISILCYTISNKLLSIEENNTVVKIDEGFFEIKTKVVNNQNQLLLETLLMGLQMLEEQYNKNLVIKESENV